MLLLIATSLMTYFERTGFTIAFTAVANVNGYSQEVKGRVMGCFFYPYAFSGFAGGALSRTFGVWRILWIANFTWIFLCLVSPLAPENLFWLRLCRFLAGLAQGMVFPCMHTALSGVTTVSTRGFVVSVVVSCIYAGAAASMMISPALVAFGGPRAQLLTAFGIGCAWLALAAPRMARDGSTRQSSVDVSYKQATPSSSLWDVPWGVILCCPAVQAIMLASFSFHLVYVLLVSWVPTFVHHILLTDLNQVGVVTKVAPWLLMSVVCTLAGKLSDVSAARMGVRNARCLLTCSGLCLTAVPLLLIAHAETPSAALALVGVALCADGFSRGGFSINHLDIGPQYAGIIAAFMNFAGTVGSATATDVGGRILDLGVDDRASWSLLFQCAAALCVASAAAYFAFAGGDTVLFDAGVHPETCCHAAAPAFKGDATSADDYLETAKLVPSSDSSS